MLQIETPVTVKPFALFNLGFRPFFLLAAGFGALSMLLWMAIYSFGQPWLSPEWPAIFWHAHEMVFGYSTAVIAGFLLTAVGNWTNLPMPKGRHLMLLAGLWLSARLFPFSGLPFALALSAFTDLLFILMLITAIAIPIYQTKQWTQMPIVFKLALIASSNILFYAAMLGFLPAYAIHWGLYSGLYLIISLILMMGRRVIPFFIERGVANAPIKLTNYKWLDLSSLFLFLIFVMVEVFTQYRPVSESLAAILFLLHAFRLWGWYDHGIWRKPLLWILYLGYSFMVLGFGLNALTTTLSLSPWIAVHAFAAGGIGLITAGMMCRIALGHTGRNVQDPPKTLKIIFVLLGLGAVCRVILPLLFPATAYHGLIITAQLCWAAGFGLFLVTYIPMLTKPRVDQRFG